MGNHTPGPWEFSGDGIWATSPWNARVKIATVTFPSPMNGIDGSANGQVLATAADLLAALRLWEAYDNCDEADFTQSGPMLLYADAIEATRAAIAKATT